MIHLVLDHARFQAGGLDEERLAVLVERGDTDVHGPFDVHAHAGQAQAAFLGGLLLLARPLQHGVHERGDGALELGPVDEQAVHLADLGGGEPDPVGVVHQAAHPEDLLAQRGVEVVDLQRA